MRKLFTYSLIILGIVSPLILLSQLSPGKLAKAHQELEGLSNCTKCHDLGNKVPDAKCLDCHDEINNMLLNNRGFHASEKVKAKSCTSCHSDHHGRNFDMIHFDQDAFDHDLSGYSLEGQHAIIDCRECHVPDNISDTEIKKREDTFLGLEQDCLSCHADYHQATLDNDCIKCHGFNEFSPADKFNHDAARYPLKGAHTEVACIECHPRELKNNLEFQRFTDLTFSDCKNCHQNPHTSSFNSACYNCHTEASFSQFIGQRSYNHSVTGFELKGKHTNVNCFDCHQDKKANVVFSDKGGIRENQCIECHNDVHSGKFGTNCVQCHSENSFSGLNDPGSFDHNLTDFNLQGLHIGVDCRECHSAKLTDPVASSNCYDCHADYHKQEFRSGGIQQDCKECHTVQKDFSYTLYGLDDHQQSVFKLEGAHLATPCFDCHLKEDHWTFRDIGTRCIDCHDDLHKGQIQEAFYPDQDCTTCHKSEAWTYINFDHDQTVFQLEGKHQDINCRECHFEFSPEGNILSQKFTNLPSNCSTCHSDPHAGQFELNGINQCARCHNADDWFPEEFDHNQSAFPLEGKHVVIECNACHKEKSDKKGKLYTYYKIEKYNCIDCHQ